MLLICILLNKHGREFFICLFVIVLTCLCSIDPFEEEETFVSISHDAAALTATRKVSATSDP
jgi:hypothetical protein